MHSTSAPTEIFIAYAHKDKELLDELEKHLRILKWKGQVTIWHDKAILPGKEWAPEIHEHLNTAQIILLLVSIDFLTSKNCENEMEQAVERHTIGEARVIPVILRKCKWEITAIGLLEALPTKGKPVTSWPDRDEVFLAVAEGVQKVVEEFLEQITKALSTNREPTFPIWNVPYPRNTLFTGRQAVLNRLHRRFTVVKKGVLAQPQAICGVGGLGKTQTALEYAHRYRREYQIVLWIRADKKETLEADFIAIASLLHLREEKESNQDRVIDSVRNWLKGQNNCNWMLILDNVNDDTRKMVSKIIQMDGKGHIILTTRMHTMGRIAQRIELETMNPVEGARFLLDRACVKAQKTSDDFAKAKAISEAVGGLPLALDQAGAYIDEKSCGVSHYLDRYRSTQRAKLHERRGKKFDFDHPESVTTTLSLSFMNVVEANPAAAALLQFCAFLSPSAIPEKIITEGAPELGELLQPVAADPDRLDSALGELLNFSLIRRNATVNTITIHPLVQAVLRDDMDEDTKHQWAKRAVQVVNLAFPDVGMTASNASRYFDQGQYALAEPEYKIALSHYQEKLAPDHPHLITYLSKLAKLYHHWGRYADAEDFYKQAQELCKQIWGKDHYIMAFCLNNLADLAFAKGDYMQADKLCNQALEICGETLVPDDPIAASCLNTLAKLYHHMEGNYAAAEPRYINAREIREKKLGSDHLDVAICLDNLARLYYDWGKYVEAEKFYMLAWAIRERLELDHPDRVISLNGLARLYFTLGKYGEAEGLYRQAQTIREKMLGPDHPDLATTLNDLAELYHVQAKYAQAEQLYIRALEIRRKALGLKHPDVASSLNNLGRLYDDQAEYTQAESFYEQAWAIYKETIDQGHPDVVSNLHNLAGVCLRKQNYKEAERLYNQALDICTEKLCIKHAARARSLANLARLYRIQDRYADAERLSNEALEISEYALGSEHPQVATQLNDLGELYYAKGEYKQAEKLFKLAQQVCEKVLGSDHPNVAIYLDAQAELCYTWGKYAEAEKLYKRAQAIREKLLGLNHPDVAISFNNLAKLYHAQGKYAQVKRLCTRAIYICKRTLGKDHPVTAFCIDTLAEFYHTTARYILAGNRYEQALKIREHAFGVGHSEVATSLNNLGRLYDDLGRLHDDAGEFKEAETLFKQSEALFEQSKAIRQNILGPGHPDVAISLNNLAGAYLRKQNSKEAERLYTEALNICTETFGNNHLSRAQCLANLARLYRFRGKYARAEHYYKEALKICKQVLGPDHPQVATRHNNLGELYYVMGYSKQKEGRYQQAREDYTRARDRYALAISIFEQALGPEHPNVAKTQKNHAIVGSLLGQAPNNTL